MESSEDLAAVAGWKLRALVKGYFHRGRMGLQQYIRDHHPAAQGRLLVRVAGVIVGADIKPRPAIKGALAHPRYIVGRQIVTEAVALIDRAPEVAGRGLHRHADTVAQPRCE